jgi:SUMO ligase MMS21 Smc5/6 complex component
MVDLGITDYNIQENKLIWDIKDLTTSNSNIRAEFDISINPEEGDIDKILVLSPGAEIRATDTDTEAVLQIRAGASTTKLEKDEIANLSSDGRIVP